MAKLKVAYEGDVIERTDDGTPKPETVTFSDDQFMQEWASLGKELGITTGKVPEMELKLFLKEEGIQVYNTQAVFDYLTAEASKEPKGTVWSLYAVRPQDQDCPDDIWAQVNKWPIGHGHVHRDLYRDKIPYPVLVTMKKLKDRFGDDITFYVAAIKQDPFLVVRYRRANLVVVERWNEPSFRDR
jgi:hypothetical protein